MTHFCNRMIKCFHRQLLPTSMKAEFTTESTTESWQAPRVFTQLPKTSKLLFTFILASACKLAFAASHSKSYPFSLFLRFRVGVQSRSGSQRLFSSQVSLIFFLLSLRTDSTCLPRACLCLLPHPLNWVTLTLMLPWSHNWMQKVSVCFCKG